ncbi:MAG: tetratricopeptide repeat protein [Cellvibrionaceae bacterium]
MASFRITALIAILVLSGCGTNSSKPDLQSLAQWRSLADQAYANKAYDKAIQLYSRLTKAVPKEASNWFRLGNAYSRVGNHQQAIAAYREVLVREPENSKAWYNSGLMELKQTAQHFVEAEAKLPNGDPVAEVSRMVNEGLLKLVEESNQKVHQLRKAKDQVDTGDVKVIVINE